MTNKEKAQEVANNRESEFGEIGDINYCCYMSALDMAQWKDEQVKQLLIDKTKLLSSSAAQDSVKRCTIKEIYRELFNEEIPNSNPYIK